ncbi:MAG: T9SS type A sorting domain-containing protein [Bacteroidota bacterium]|jgi:uncharacterized repeat protein (TIGR01451 family)
MKKLILIFLVLVLKFAPAKAQWVTIPDPNFVTKLTQLFPSCMNGNQMDTTCYYIVNEDSLIIPSLSLTDLTGLEYFDYLTYLHCGYNDISQLPRLPQFLNYIDCQSNELDSLPPLPYYLDFLSCQSNPLIHLPSLPPNLETLFCGYCLLTDLPDLPNSLKYLYYEDNLITSLPALPSTLDVLRGWNNPLTSLPPLPNTLWGLWVVDNQLTNIPPLPNSLHTLYCGGNPLTSFPVLPAGLNTLGCENLQLTSLPQLPLGVTRLYCFDNLLTSLPSLSSNITELNCSNNLLTSLPQLPNQMYKLLIDSNQISCLTNLPQVYNGYNSYNANITGNPLTCVPNQTNYSLGLPLCLDNDPANNPLNCQAVANIAGYVYRDLNANCTYNNVDLRSQNIPVKLYDNQNNFLGYSNTVNGVYSFTGLQADSFDVKINDNTLLFSMACGQANNQTVVLDSMNQTISNINFPIVCDTIYDLSVQSVNHTGIVFPGQPHTINTNITNYVIGYNLNCNFPSYSGTVSLQITGPVSFISTISGALTPVVNGNTFTYNISNFNNLTNESFGLEFLTDTTAQANDQICVHVEISPNPMDADTTNNVYDFCYNVVNSYDPNMKEVYPINVLPGYDDWFTYTIHFQNTGNAPAFNIRLRDTLDNQLDLNTFEVLGYSHPANVTVSGNILTVRFNNIMLPDSTSDYEGSMGYFQYRIKPFPNLPLGSQISNTAYIYFDYNAPIITNTTENNFEFPVSVSSIASSENKYSVYPNPSTGIFTFKDAKAIQRVEVYNVMGQEIAVFAGDNTNKVSKQINLSNYSKGIYFAKINGSVVIKLVKE